jgi:sortase A
MTVARALGAVGRLLVVAGALVLLFVAYQLWGTGLHEARAQDELREELERSLPPAPTTTTTTATTAPPPGVTTTAPPPTTTTTTTPPPPPRVAPGDAVALLEIPRIGVEKAVVEGVSVADLKRGPGHYPGSPLPGQPGNAAIAGHRTTYGAPFYELDELRIGDVLLVTTRQGEFRYLVDRKTVVRPHEVGVLRPTMEARLTLSTCNPRFSARERLIVSGVLDGTAAPAPPPTAAAPAVGPGGGDREAGDAAEVVSAEEAGLSGEEVPRRPAVLWGAAAAAVGGLTWLLGRLWRRWPVYLLGVPAFLVVLFFFYENVARLLPANI